MKVLIAEDDPISSLAMYEQKRSRKHDDVSENIHSPSSLNSDRSLPWTLSKQTLFRPVSSYSSGPTGDAALRGSELIKSL